MGLGQDIQDGVAGASGATLGFILGDMPGAYAGYHAGKYLSQNGINSMVRHDKQLTDDRKARIAKIRAQRVEKQRENLANNNRMQLVHYSRPGKRKSSTSSSSGKKRTLRLSGPVVKRRQSYSSASSGSVSRMSTASRKSSINRMGLGVDQDAITNRQKTIKKSFKGKAKKKVKVSKHLRAKINKVLEAKKIYGSMRNVICGGVQKPSFTFPHQQNVFPLPIPQSANVQRGLLFDVRWLMYVCSRLFNGRPSDETTAGITLGNWSNILVEGGGVGTVQGWGNFATNIETRNSSFNVEVTNLKAKIHIKNNSGRTQYLKMFVCKKKKEDSDLTGTVTGFPIHDWTQALFNDFNAKAIGGLEGTAAYTKSSGINIPRKYGTTAAEATVDINLLYSHPKLCKSWLQEWSYNEVNITLEPGQTSDQWIQGDTGMYDYSKFYDYTAAGGLVFNNLQKTDRHVFFVNMPEMASTTTGPRGGRLGESNTGDLFLFETQIFCSVQMPETAGTIETLIPTASLPVTDIPKVRPLSQRKRAYAIDLYWDLGTTATYNVNFDDNTTTRQTS